MRDDDVFRATTQLENLKQLVTDTVAELQGWVNLQKPTYYKNIGEGGFGTVAPNERGNVVKRSELKDGYLITWVNAARELHVLAHMARFDTYFPVFVAAQLEVPYLYLEFEKADCDAFDYADRVEGAKDREHAIELLDLHIGNALHFMHWNTFYHCDVKLENVLVFHSSSDRLQYKLTDFGHAHWGSSPDLKTRYSYGTEGYVPLESVLKKTTPDNVGVVRDWWAFGVSLYAFATHKMPPCNQARTRPWQDHINHMLPEHPLVEYCRPYLDPFAKLMQQQQQQ